MVINLSDLQDVLGFTTCSESSRKFLVKLNIPQQLALQKKKFEDAAAQKPPRKIESCQLKKKVEAIALAPPKVKPPVKHADDDDDIDEGAFARPHNFQGKI